MLWLASRVTFEFSRASRNLSGFFFPGVDGWLRCRRRRRLAFCKECKEKTAVRNSSNTDEKAGDQLQRLWQVFSLKNHYFITKYHVTKYFLDLEIIQLQAKTLPQPPKQKFPNKQHHQSMNVI